MSSKKKRRKKRKSRKQGVSTVQPKSKGARNHTNRPTPGTSQAAPSNSAEEIHRLILRGKAKAAVSKAKLYYKSHGTDKSEMILVDAYAARVREIIAKGYIVEAKTLLELIRERYNCPDRLLSELNGVIAIREGKIDELVRPLDDPEISPEKRITIERIIKNELIDPNLLAQSTGISADHPLKSGAQTVAETIAGMQMIREKVGLSSEKVQEMGKHLTTVYLSSRDLYAGKWKSAIEELERQPQVVASLPCNGAEVCAETILRYLNWL